MTAALNILQNVERFIYVGFVFFRSPEWNILASAHGKWTY
jgi:hypothetical protein